jgi:hypothetical protein
MLRILVVVFFWLCAVGILSLSISAEAHELPRGTERPVKHSDIGNVER